jgi:hypothetical protein
MLLLIINSVEISIFEKTCQNNTNKLHKNDMCAINTTIINFRKKACFLMIFKRNFIVYIKLIVSKI